MLSAPQWLNELLPSAVDKPTQHDVVASLLFVLLLMIGRWLIRRSVIARTDLSVEVKRRWLVTLRNVWLIIFVAGLTLIWGRELQTLAVSMVAIAAALVLATKEMIMCLMGSIYRTSTHAFSVGDRIEFNKLKGQVVDTNVLSFTVAESSYASSQQGTVGRVVTIPNSLLLANPVFNETRLGHFVMHTVHVRIPREDDWHAAELILLSAGQQAITEYDHELAQHALEQQSLQVLNALVLEPRVRIDLEDIDSIAFQLQLPVPLGQRAKVEQAILRAFLRQHQPAQQGGDSK
ncbi:mechanosensitive ion channel family protein [Chitinibacter fontanus]|uniref:Mechanosensitive ion channel family protein n=1 Tax=Chitinibacter fontanus TaxID=1737446 RepID=A0A7D5Z241_9NEIS|nr:mechanosensitive ion channel family protein [Chitinibacter fontanus]QLI80143.1 mechanosensitive ion channel family protein [Chitinibacter fontanus]